MKLEDMNELNLPHFEHDFFRSDVTVGDIVAKAELSTTADAMVCGYAKGGNSFHFSFQQVISQTEDSQFPGSRGQPKDFPIYVIGVVKEGEAHKLAYATSRNHHTKKIHTLRLTDIDHILHIRDYRLVLKHE